MQLKVMAIAGVPETRLVITFDGKIPTVIHNLYDGSCKIILSQEQAEELKGELIIRIFEMKVRKNFDGRHEWHK